MKKFNKKGFTIVELVIVVAVIAILAAVLIPTFSGLVGDANEAKALQQARSLYTEYAAKVKYDEGETAEETVIVEVKAAENGAKGQYVVIKDGQVDKEVCETEAEAFAKFDKFNNSNVKTHTAKKKNLEGYTDIFGIDWDAVNANN